MIVQLEFNFGELPGKTPALPYFDTPKNDNERLLNYQWRYKEQGDENALNDMYKLGYTVAAKFITNIGKRNKHVKELCGSDKEEKAHNAITYIIARYLQKKDFAINESFTAYIYLRVQHELFYQRKVDKIITYCDAPYERQK